MEELQEVYDVFPVVLVSVQVPREEGVSIMLRCQTEDGQLETLDSRRRECHELPMIVIFNLVIEVAGVVLELAPLLSDF